MAENQSSVSDSRMEPNRPSRWQAPHRTLLFWLIILFIGIAYSVYKYEKVHAAETRTPTLPVVAAVSTTKDVPVYVTALGNVTPTSTVTVRTQIAGQLFNVFFKEGQFVKTGDMLAQIDPRPYEAQLTQYEGQLARDSALLENARIDLKRYQTLWKQDSVAQQTLATQESLVQQYEGAVQTDQGLIASTKVNLIYCNITSPIDGRVGLRLVDAGNFVQVSDTTGIAVINNINPITVIFAIPEDNVPQVIPSVYAGKQLHVEAYDRQQNRLLAAGDLITIDNQIDVTTGTVKLRAIFENEDNMLFPNQFVNIKLLVNTLKQATVIPTAAIQHGTQGDFVFAITENGTVRMQKITVGITTGENTVVTSGLLPGKEVVVEGSDKLTDGAKVAVTRPASTNPIIHTAELISHWRFMA